MKKHSLWIVAPVWVAVAAALLCLGPGCKKPPHFPSASPPIIIGDGSMFIESKWVQIECKGKDFELITPHGEPPYKMEWVTRKNGPDKKACKGDCVVQAAWQKSNSNGEFFIKLKNNPAGMRIKIKTNPDCDDGGWVKIMDPANPEKAIGWKHEVDPAPNPSGARITFKASSNSGEEEICNGVGCAAEIHSK